MVLVVISREHQKRFLLVGVVVIIAADPIPLDRAECSVSLLGIRKDPRVAYRISRLSESLFNSLKRIE